MKEAAKRIISTVGTAQESQYNEEEIKVRQYNRQKEAYTGISIGYDVFYHDCTICGNKRKIAHLDADGKFALKQCECVATIKIKSSLAKSGLTALVDKYTLNNYITTEKWQESIKNAASAFINDTCDNWFFIGGQVGAGKSHICTGIVMELIKQGKNAIYMMWQEESVMLNANVNSEQYEKRIKELKTTPVLYIDDLFKNTPTEGDRKRIFELLNYRYNNPNLITIISSELQIRDIINIDEAVGSRIYERSKKYQININADIKKNYRLR